MTVTDAANNSDLELREHDDIKVWKYSPCYLSFVRGVSSELLSPKASNKGFDIFLDVSLKNGQANSWIASDLRCHNTHTMYLQWDNSFVVFTFDLDIYVYILVSILMEGPSSERTGCINDAHKALNSNELIQVVFSGYWHSPTTSNCSGHDQATFLGCYCMPVFIDWTIHAWGNYTWVWAGRGLFRYKDPILPVLEIPLWR